MSVRVIAKFQEKSRAGLVRKELRKLGVTAHLLPAGGGPKFMVDIVDRDFRYQAMRQGLLGAATGCALGTLAVPFLPVKELIFSVILPLSTTYVGVAFGLFVAGLFATVRKKLRTSNIVKEGCISLNQERENSLDIYLTDETQLASVHRFLAGQGATSAQFIVTQKQIVTAPVIEHPISLLLSA